MNLKLLVLSDIHSDRSIIGRIDKDITNKEIAVLVVCGDITHYGDLSEAKETLKELIELDIPVVFVPGNCDPKELASTQSVYGAANIHGRYKEVGGLHFLGIGGSPLGPFNTPFEMSENEIGRILKEADIGSNDLSRFILVSHTPPVNTKVDLSRSGIHAGSQAVIEFVETEKPFLVLCGHIHEARGKDVVDGVLVVNPGPAHMGLYTIVDVNEDIKVNLDVSQ